MPSALGHLLPAGVKGCFLLIGVLGTIAGIGAYCMQMGTGFIQDVVLPLRGRALETERQVRWLRWSVTGFGILTVFFSLFFKPADYLQLLMLLIGSIYLGGAGIVILGGLYWSRGTTRAAWAALITGAGLAATGWGLQSFWGSIAPALASMTGDSALSHMLLESAGRFPLNGQVMSLITAAVCMIIFIVVSLVTCREPHDMDRLLHRGVHRVQEDSDAAPEQAVAPRNWLARFLQIDGHFTRGDRALAYMVFLYSLLWNVVFLLVLAWSFLIARWPDHWWWNYVLIQNIAMPLVICVINTFWFSSGALRDLFRLQRKLKSARLDPQDDGQVH